MNRSRRRNSVWDSFKQEGSFARCKKCDVLLKYTDGVISNLIYHLGKNHSSTLPPDEAVGSNAPSSQEEGYEIEFEDVFTANEQCYDSKERKRVKRSSVWDIFVREQNEVKCSLCDARLKYCNSTTNMMNHIRGRHQKPNVEDEIQGKRSVSEANKLVCKMIEKDMLPVSIVDGEGFRELLKYFVGDYELPPISVITSSIQSSFQQKVSELKTLLATVEMVALSLDCWAALPTERYVTIISHFISTDWQARSAVLQTRRASASQNTVNNLADILTDTVETWGLTGKVIACSHNASTPLPLQKCSGVTWDSVVCFPSALQLAVSDGLTDDMLSLVRAAGKLVNYFNNNSHISNALERMQEQMQLPQKKLIRSSKARWDTICDMFEHLIEHRWAIKAVLSDRTTTKKQEVPNFEMTEGYWEIMENLTPVLATLRWATKVMSSEREVSISNIYPITFSLLQTHLAVKEHDIKQVTEFKNKVQESLRKHLEVDSVDLVSKPALIASVLDPRHKHLSFLTPTKRLAAKVKLHEMVSKKAGLLDRVVPKVEDLDTPVTPLAGQMVTLQQKEGDAKNAMLLLLGDNYSTSYANDSEAQVDYYLRDISPSLDMHPLEWWKINGPRFPMLATLARHYLCIPGLSVPYDQRFSEAGETFARMRTRLSPEHVDMMTFLNKNA